MEHVYAVVVISKVLSASSDLDSSSKSSHRFSTFLPSSTSAGPSPLLRFLSPFSISTVPLTTHTSRNSRGKVHVPVYKFSGGGNEDDGIRDVVEGRGELWKGGKASFFIRYLKNDPKEAFVNENNGADREATTHIRSITSSSTATTPFSPPRPKNPLPPLPPKTLELHPFLPLTPSLQPQPHIYMSYANTYIVSPLALVNPTKRNIVLCITLRRGTLSPTNDSMILLSKPLKRLINPRSVGPRMCQYGYSSCTYHSTSPTFPDEFKFSLPDSLEGHKEGDLCIVAEVFHVRVKESTKRKKSKRGSNLAMANPSSAHLSASNSASSFSSFSLRAASSDDTHDTTTSYGSSTVASSSHPPPNEHSNANDELPLPSNVVDFQGAGILPLIPSRSLLPNSSYSISISYQSQPQPVNPASSSSLSAASDSSTRSPTPVSNLPFPLHSSSSPSSSFSSPSFSSEGRLVLYKHTTHQASSSSSSPSILRLKTHSLASLHPQHDILQDAFNFHPPDPIPCSLPAVTSSPSSDSLSLIKILAGLCELPPTVLSTQFPRLLKLLTLCTTSGAGSYSEALADPTVTTNLRINSLAVLLVTINKVYALYQRSSSDVSAVIGHPWNVSAYGKIVASLCIAGSSDIPPPSPTNSRASPTSFSSGNDNSDFEDYFDSPNHTPRARCATYPRDGDVSTLTSSSPATSTPSSTPPPTLTANTSTGTGARTPTAFNTAGNLYMHNELSTIKEAEEELSPTNLSRSFDSSDILNASKRNNRNRTPSPPGGLTSMFPTLNLDSPPNALPKVVLKPNLGMKSRHRTPPNAPSVPPAQSKPPPIINGKYDDYDDDGDEEGDIKMNFMTANSSLNLNTSSASIIKSTEGFLDKLGANLGITNYNNSVNDDFAGENKSVGAKHHRKTKSVCSIDWSLSSSTSTIAARPNPDATTTSSSKALQTTSGNIHSSLSSSSSSDSTGSFSNINSPVKHARQKNPDGFLSAFMNAVKTLSPKNSSDENSKDSTRLPPTSQGDCKIIDLPGYETRLESASSSPTRWWPYLYEVLICQWVVLLKNQQKNIEKEEIEDKCIHAACIIGKGVTVSMAPVMFDIIQISLCSHISEITSSSTSSTPTSTTSSSSHSSKSPPLVSLSPHILDNLSALVGCLTDACVATRNFDKVSSRRIAREVNMKLIEFIRDLFAFLPTSDVHRMINTYFSSFHKPRSRYHMEGVSKLSVRYSTEVLNLRLDAVKILARTTHFVEVNSLIANEWDPKYTVATPTTTLNSINRHPKTKAKRRLFFNEALQSVTACMQKPKYRVSRNSPISPPHWLACIVVDQIMDTASQRDFEVQGRAADILLRLFQSHNEEGVMMNNRNKIIAMYVPVIRMLTNHVQSLLLDDVYSSRRKKMLASFLFILQSAPQELLGALWRDLILSCKGCGRYEFLGINLGRGNSFDEGEMRGEKPAKEFDPTLLLVFDLLSLSLRTLEYVPTDNSDEDNHFNQWYSHDATSIVTTAARAIVTEMIILIRPVVGRSASAPDLSAFHVEHLHLNKPIGQSELNYSVADLALFVRSVGRVYLEGLSLNQSDGCVVNLILASVELLKAFGLKLFLLAMGDSLQDLLRVLLFHAGARRATVRVQALEFLVLLLRACWAGNGTLTQIRVPCLAVFVEVMDRVAARNAGLNGLGSEKDVIVALSPLVKSMERLQHSSVSRNLSFKSGLTRFAKQLVVLYKAYVAVWEIAHDIMGVHYEGIEEALFEAARIFNRHELPYYRISWLRKLAEFHELHNRQKFAESALCRYEIFKTYEEARRISHYLWHSRPFPLWEELSRRRRTYSGQNGINEAPSNLSDDSLDGVDGGVSYMMRPTGGNEENELVEALLQSASSFKKAGMLHNAKMVYESAASFFNTKFDDEGMQRCYLALSSLIRTSIPVLDSVCCENPRMATVTGINLDPMSFQPEEYGRYFRVWFHGSAPDHLVGEEFVYRAPHYATIESFGDHVSNVISSMLPPYVPIDLVLDDGLHSNSAAKAGAYVPRPSQRRVKMQKVVLSEREKNQDGGVCQIKITPLRPVEGGRGGKGSAKWFESVSARGWSSSGGTISSDLSEPTCRRPSPQAVGGVGYGSTQGSIVGSVAGSMSGSMRSEPTRMTTWSGVNAVPDTSSKHCRGESIQGSEMKNDIEGLTTFEFTSLKSSAGEVNDRRSSLSSSSHSSKILRVTQLQVQRPFPACVSRQPVSSRAVFSRSILSSNMCSVCSWNSILYQAVLATNNNVRETNGADGIGKDGAKVVVDALHRSGIAAMAVKVLTRKKDGKKFGEEEMDGKKQLCRAIIMFLELTHMLTSKNRELLLGYVSHQKGNRQQFPNSMEGGGGSDGGKERKGGWGARGSFSSNVNKDSLGAEGAMGSTGAFGEEEEDIGGLEQRLKSAIGVQSELQRSFSSTAGTLYPILHSWIGGEVPNWILMSSAEGYFSSGSYSNVGIEGAYVFRCVGNPSNFS